MNSLLMKNESVERSLDTNDRGGRSWFLEDEEPVEWANKWQWWR